MVCRLEDNKGNGVYRCKEIDFNFKRKDVSIHCPPPDYDAELRFFWESAKDSNLHSEYKFGFKTLSQMRAWFKRHTIKALATRSPNVLLAIYRVAEIQEGTKQIVSKEFKQENLVTRITLQEYLFVTSKKRVVTPQQLLTFFQ